MEKTNPKISVIVPVYNVERYLPRCIDSILAQTFTDFELLLIDDGSKDSSGEICDEYASKDSRVRVFHKENGGVSSARNVGLDNARGEWIAFCDSDDWVDANWLFDFAKDLDCDMVVQGYNIRTHNQEYVRICFPHSCLYKKDNLGDFFSEIYSLDNVGFVWCRLFKNKIISEKELRFNHEYVVWEDLDFIFQYIKNITTVRLQNNAHYYYIKPDYSVKYSGKQKNVKSLECIYNLINNYVDVVGYCANPLWISFVNSYVGCLINVCKDRNYKIAYCHIGHLHSFIRLSHCFRGLSLKSKVFVCLTYIVARG